MLLQYFFVPAGLYYCDFGLISAMPTVRLNCYYLGSHIFGFELTLIFMLRVCFCDIFFGIRFRQFSFQFWDISRYFLSRLPLFLKVRHGFEAQSVGFVVFIPNLVDFLIFKSHFSWNLDFWYRTNFFGNFLTQQKNIRFLGGGDIFSILGWREFFGLVLKIK